MNYEFHVGDYVETVYGDIGYITSVEIDFTGAPYIDLCTSIKNKIDIRCCEYHNFASEIPKYFIRIGRYDFTKKDKKIEKIGLLLSSSDYNDTKAIIELGTKINELIDAVNELMEK